MNKQLEEQTQLAREILQLTKQHNVAAIQRLKLLTTEESPSLFVLLEELNSLSNEAKALITEHAKDKPFAKSVIDVIIKNKLININGSAWNGYRNGIIRLSFALSEYFGISHLSEFTFEHWEVLLQALVDESSFWRNESAFSIENAVRTFIKAVNTSHSDYQIALRANKNSNNQNARAGRQTQVEYLASKGQHFREWVSLFEEWHNLQILKNSKSIKASISLFLQFLEEKNLHISPAEFMLLSKKPSFWNYLKNLSYLKPNTLRSHALRMYEFTNWIINDKLSDEDDGDLITLATPLLPLDVYHHVSNYTAASTKGKADNVKAILPIKYLNLIRQILTENDHEWPRSQEWTYKKMLNHDTGEVEWVWHPHLTYLYLFLLEVPVRKIQVLCLDSGEGDDSQWLDGEWHPNTSIHAGYWSRNHGDKMGRGVTRKAYNNGVGTTSIYINTNKTQDVQKGFSATSGYTINWHNESLIKLINYMREWQKTYNPVYGPVSYRDLPPNTFSDSPTEAVMNLIPDRFYLFRYPLNSATHSSHASAPPADYLTFRFWHLLMNELERRLNEMGENVVITLGWTANIPNKSIFTPHSLRGSGLTALAETGVPIEILSKVVAGHASILMTLGYIKYNNAYISNILDEARLKMEQNEQENYTQYLKNATWDDAYKYSVFNEELDSDQWETSKAAHLFENRQIGICPNSGTRCGDGGEVIRKNGTNKPVHGPVIGGSGNCVRCRFLITGLPFLVPLWLKANKDLSEAQQVSIEVETLSKDLERLRSKRFNIVREEGLQQVPQSLQTEIKQVEARLDTKSSKLDEILSNAHTTYNLVEQVKVLAKQENSNLPALLSGDGNFKDDSEFHEVSLFKQRDFIVQASRLYPHVKDEKLEMERDHFIDQIMFNIGLTPITLSPLTETEKKAACDAAANYLNSKLSDYEIQMLELGKIDIRKLGIGKNVAEELSIAVDGMLKKVAIKEVE